MNNHQISSGDPYFGNILVARLASIPTPKNAAETLIHSPPIHQNIGSIPKHIRLHHLMEVRDFHYPSTIERQLFSTIDLMLRQGYRVRNPQIASSWSAISGESRRSGLIVPAMAASVEGLSGVGKTQACIRSLAYHPQVIEHESFPRLVGKHQQVVWLSVEIPPSGKASDLARSLMEAWRTATGSRRFDTWLEKEKITDGMRALDEWRQVAVGHFLGVLHLDEIQNLFKLSNLKQRTARTGSSGAPELSIVEDQLLRWLLYLTNSGQIPLLISGTPDGIGALTKRLSTLERINTMGYHAFEPIKHHQGKDLDKSFLGVLARYQYVKHKIPMDANLANLILDLSGGIHRIVMALWIAAHRVAFENQDDSLRPEDFTKAANTLLSPLKPAIHALKNKNIQGLGRYEDLIPRDTVFWSSFWSNSN